MAKRLARDVAIMYAAQRLVDWWLRTPARGPFNRLLDDASWELWDHEPDARPKRDALHKVANAIRLGRGHARTNPEPLLALARQALGQGGVAASPDGVPLEPG